METLFYKLTLNTHTHTPIYRESCGTWGDHVPPQSHSLLSKNLIAIHVKHPLEFWGWGSNTLLKQHWLLPSPLVASQNLKESPCCWRHHILRHRLWRNQARVAVEAPSQGLGLWAISICCTSSEEGEESHQSSVVPLSWDTYESIFAVKCPIFWLHLLCFPTLLKFWNHSNGLWY